MLSRQEKKMDSDQTLFRHSLIAIYLIAPPTLIFLQFLTAPYGKHHRLGWGITMSPPLAWFLMESPTIWLTLILFPLGNHYSNTKALILITPFLVHYFHRTVLYPIRLTRQKTTSRFPVSVALVAFGFNFLNAYLQARWVSHYKNYEADGWFWWQFSVGLVVFVGGMAVNIWSDMVLVSLKRESGGGYKVPRGGLFELVSCPNYFGEILEWLGWAVMTWSWVGFGFFLYTCANLVPRACANHKWYLDKFEEDYPRSRKAVIPFLY